jgi:DNA-binding NarL/FixJ family response regulator
MTEPKLGVLIADHEGFFREAIRDALAEAGIESRTVSTGDEVLSASDDPAIGVVVLDLQLSEPGSLEVLEQLRTRRPELRVIALSTATDQGLVLEALRVHACDYLAKPLHQEELVLTVQRALRSYQVEATGATLRERLRRLEEQCARLAEPAPVGDRPIEWLAERAALAVAVVLDATKTSLMVLDESGEVLRVEAATGRDLVPGDMDEAKAGEGVAGVALAEVAAIAVADVAADARFAARGPSDRYSSSSFAVAACPGPRGPLGVLCATDRGSGVPFGEDDLALLRILALEIGQRLATALGSESDVDTAEQAEQRAQPGGDGFGGRDAELARAICDVIADEVEPDRIIDAAMRQVASEVPAAPAALYLIEDGTLALQGQCEGDGSSDRSRLPTGRGLTGTVAQTGRLVASDQPASDPRFDPKVDTPADGGVAPLLCVPLRLRGKVVGLARAFGSVDSRISAETGEMLSAVLSAAVRNVLLYRSLLDSIDDVAEARREARGAGRGR